MQLALPPLLQLERPNILNRQYRHVFTVTTLTASLCLQLLQVHTGSPNCPVPQQDAVSVPWLELPHFDTSLHFKQKVRHTSAPLF
jgi:hypothetical protein